MIPRLTSPSVCVIDDEEPDYRPILDALLKLGIGCVHVRGDSESQLPENPFAGLRIVFTDLYLNQTIGKTAATHTANVFKRLVAADTAPVLVVIWSKHTDDQTEDPGLPPDDQPTAADMFKESLLVAEPRFRERLIFTVMPKPKQKDRPENTAHWIESLQAEIETKLKEFPACDLLWSWESLVREAAIAITEEVTTLALDSNSKAVANEPSDQQLDDRLKLVFRHLAKEQGGPDCSSASAHTHLSAALAQTLIDRLEHSAGLKLLSHHGTWLSDQVSLPKSVDFAPQLNGLLLTAATTTGGRPFVPGTVYRINDNTNFENAFGLPTSELISSFYQDPKKDDKKKAVNKDAWNSLVTPVAIEISPACDFHQKSRFQALLIAGLLVPSVGQLTVKNSGAFESLPIFNLRWPREGQEETEVFLVFCSRYKLTMLDSNEPEWLTPWFRLRELPTAFLRNWHASHSARVGYVSFR